jgi:tetratricopeptide (TPR) repeat protein
MFMSTMQNQRIRAAWLRALLLAAATALLAGCGSAEERSAEYMRRAQALYDQGKLVEATLEARNAAQIAPKNAAAHYLLAQIAEQQKDLRTMVQRLTMAVNANPDLVPARVKLGTLYFFGEVYDKAEEQARAAMILAADNPEVLVLNARLLFHQDKKEEAIRELDGALAIKPDLLDAIILKASAVAVTDPAAGLAMLEAAQGGMDKEKARPLRQLRIAILAQQKRSADVEQAYRDLIRDFPEDQQLQYELARFYSREGRVDDAEAVMRGVVRQAPDDVSAHLGLAQFLAQMRGVDAAEQVLEAFIAESPDQLAPRAALGRLYEAAKKPDAALAVYEELAKRAPRSKEGIAARVRIAVLHIEKNELPQAMESINGVLADEPDNPDALLIRAGFYVQDKKFDEGIADMRTVLRKDPQNTRAMLLMARTHALTGDRVLSKEAYRRLLATDPSNADGSRELAAMEMADNNPAGAEQIIRDRIKATPGDLDAASQLIEMLITRKAWSEAEAEARALDSRPGNMGLGQFHLGRIYQAQRRTKEAATAFGKAMEQNPASPLALEGLVFSLQDLGRDAEAKRVLEEFRARYPANMSARFIEGGIYARRGNMSAAEQVFSEIVKDQPGAARVWIALANVHRDDVARRIDIYQRGLAANPGNSDLGLLLGTEYEMAGRFEEAISHYEQLLKVNPTVLPAVNNLASLLCDHRSDETSYARAMELAQRLENATNPAELDTVGWAYYRNKNYVRAVEFLQKAVDGARDASLLRYHLGMAYFALGDSTNARRELQLAVEKAKGDFPGLAEAKQTLIRLNLPGAKT